MPCNRAGGFVKAINLQLWLDPEQARRYHKGGKSGEKGSGRSSFAGMAAQCLQLRNLLSENGID
jgi:hypothetical protein